MISIATEKDIPDVYEACLAFFLASEYSRGSSFNKDTVLKTIQSVIDGGNDQGVILLTRNEQNQCTGLLGALKTNLPFSKDSIACELLWWVYPEYRNTRDGIELFKAFEYWAKEVAKVQKIQISNLESIQPKVMEKIYTKFKYKKCVTTWMKDI